MLLPLVDVLAARGVALAPILAEAGAPEGLFSDPENRASDVVACRLLAIAAQRLELPHLGLLIGRRPQRLRDLGLMGEMVTRCATVGMALRALISHLHLNNRGAVPVMLEIGPTRVIFGYAFYYRMDVSIRPAMDIAIASGFTVLEQLCGPEWRPLEVRFAYEQPSDWRPYEQVFGGRVRFNSELSGIVFPASLLDLRLPEADPERHAELEVQVREARIRAGMSFGQQVRAVLPQAILGACSSEAEVASLFAMHERTLRRRLLAEGEHFHALLASTRRELATQLLANTRLSVGDIARALGYADPNVFSRAFRGWTGANPTSWRARLNDPSAAP